MASNNEAESPCPPERNYSDPWPNWASHEYHSSWGARERLNEREKSDGLDLHSTTRNWSSMESTSPPGEMPKAGVVRGTNGIKLPEQESLFHKPSPPTGPRAGVKPRRASPDRKGVVYRRDWTSPENSGGLGYRDRDAIEKNRRKHPDNGPRHTFKHVADTYRPGYYPGGRGHACDDPSRSPPLRQGGVNADKGYVPANRSRDPTRDQASQEGSRSPLQRAREAAREVADRIVRDSLNNLPKAKEDSNQGQKRVEPLERNQADLAAGTCSDIARGSDSRTTVGQNSLPSRGLPCISQHQNFPSGHDSVVGNNTVIAPTEIIPRSVKQVFTR